MAASYRSLPRGRSRGYLEGHKGPGNFLDALSMRGQRRRRGVLRQVRKERLWHSPLGVSVLSHRRAHTVYRIRSHDDCLTYRAASRAADLHYHKPLAWVVPF